MTDKALFSSEFKYKERNNYTTSEASYTLK